MKDFILRIVLVLSAGVVSHAQVLVANEATDPRLKGCEIYQSEEQVVFMIDGAQLKSIGQLHEALRIGLQLPAYYGKNLDALYDSLTDQLQTPMYIHFVFQNSSQMKINLGKKQFEDLIEVMRSARASRHNLVSEYL